MTYSCKYCGKSLPEAGLDGIPFGKVKGGAGKGVPVCITCLHKPANQLQVCDYKKVTVVE